ncbi:MAG TPA: fumarylacetoacetate hydrolase family protein, partial [Ferruginibacter sp.]|nr:fumarylacetoacetate hydrolase family protein [Ferruginibacter sp.]
MKLVTYLKDEHEQLALYIDGKLYDTDGLHPDLPVSMAMFLNYWDDVFPLAAQAESRLRQGMIRGGAWVAYDQSHILAPVPHPTSCRDGYAFRQHVAAARRNRKV